MTTVAATTVPMAVGKTAPGQMAPGQINGGQRVYGQTARARTALGQRVYAGTAPGLRVHTRTVPGQTAPGQINGGLATGAPRPLTVGTPVMTTRTRLSWTPSRIRSIPATSTPTGLAPVPARGPARPTCHPAHHVPAPSAACPARLARHGRLARLRAIRPPSSAVLVRAPTTPPAARDRVQAVPDLDRKDRLASVRAILPPGRTHLPPLETRRLPGLAPPGRNPAGSAKRRRPAPGRIPQRAPIVSSKDSRARMVRRHSINSLRAATRMDHPRQTDAPQECR
jgi:hypothetical protein